MRALISRMLPDRMRGYARRIHQQVSRRAVILLYHRVIDMPADPQLLCVSPRHFSEQMQVLRKYARTASLSRVSQDLKNERLGKSHVVVTFDDGYADNFR